MTLQTWANHEDQALVCRVSRQSTALEGQGVPGASLKVDAHILSAVPGCSEDHGYILCRSEVSV